MLLRLRITEFYDRNQACLRYNTTQHNTIVNLELCCCVVFVISEKWIVQYCTIWNSELCLHVVFCPEFYSKFSFILFFSTKKSGVSTEWILSADSRCKKFDNKKIYEKSWKNCVLSIMCLKNLLKVVSVYHFRTVFFNKIVFTSCVFSPDILQIVQIVQQQLYCCVVFEF